MENHENHENHENYIEYPLQDGYINRFAITEITAEPRRFKKMPLAGKVNEWLKKGFSIHENPCRKEMLAERLGIAPPSPAENVNYKLYFPFGNIGVEQSAFYYVPTYLRRYGKATLHSKIAARKQFQLETCGAATIWLNGKLIVDFTPFTRNMVKSTQFALDLQQGDNYLIFCLEDLAERDTDYYIRLRCLDFAEPPTIRLPIPKQSNADKIKQLETFLTNVHTTKQAYIDEPATIILQNPVDNPVNLTVKISPATLGTALESAPISEMQNITVDKNQQILQISSKFLGYCVVNLACECEGIKIARNIDTQFVSSKMLNVNQPSFAKRKQTMIDLIAESPVDNIFKATAILHKIENDSTGKLHKNENIAAAEKIFATEIGRIIAKKDCADFHLAVLLHSYITFSDKLSTEIKSTIKNAVLGFRYWIDEPGDDVMWFFSENHALMFHVCQYLAGELFPQETFESSGLTGTELKAKAEKLLATWFDSFFDEFITEWNSPAYIPIDYLGLAVLYLHGNETLRQNATIAMNQLSQCLAEFSFDGALMGTCGRVYERHLKGSFSSETTAFLHMLFNTSTVCKVDFILPLAVSDYAPPEAVIEEAKPRKTPIMSQHPQGFEDHVMIKMYKDQFGILTAAEAFKPYEMGYQEHIVHCALDKTTQVFVNHPGEGQPFGSGRPSFWAGNGVLPHATLDWTNSVTLNFDLQDSKIQYTHAFVPLSEFDEYQITENAVVLRKNQAMIGITAKNGLKLTEIGVCTNIEFISYGQKNTWTITLSNVEEHANLGEFLGSLKISNKSEKE